MLLALALLAGIRPQVLMLLQVAVEAPRLQELQSHRAVLLLAQWGQKEPQISRAEVEDPSYSYPVPSISQLSNERSPRCN